MSACLTIVHFFPRIRREEGGVVQVILDLCQMTAAAGHRVILTTCDAADVPADWHSEKSNPTLCAVQSASLRRLSPHGLHQFANLLNQVDVAHLHTPWEWANLQLANMLRRRAVPYVVTVHGMLDDYSMKQKSWKKRAFLTLGGRKLFSKANAVHFTAQAEKDQATRWIPGNYLPVVQACALDLEPYEDLPGPGPALNAFPQLATNDPKILFLSRLHPKKGVELLIEAGGILRAQGLPIQLVIAGPGDDEYAQGLRQLAVKLGLGDSTHFLGMVRGQVKLSLYELADVFVLPTHQENFGLVLPEALACRTPVVTTRGTDIWRELQEAGAKIVDNRSPAIADAIREILSDDQERRALGERGRDYVMDWLSEVKVSAGYERMYRETIRRAKENGKTYS
jgi:glycosyltransferase involved in cell wall biosynthesis